MNALKQELETLQNLEATVGLDDTQATRLAELPSLIEQAEKTEQEKSKELQSALAQKEHWREKAEKAELERKALEDKLNKGGSVPESVDALDLIKLGKKLEGYSDAEIDFATAHAKTKNPEDILKTLEDPMVQMAIQGTREKEAKAQLALKPNGTQPDGQETRSLDDVLNSGSLADKEKKLIELGLYVPPKGKPDRVNIGPQR